jgi:hypothetical protein
MFDPIIMFLTAGFFIYKAIKAKRAEEAAAAALARMNDDD